MKINIIDPGLAHWAGHHADINLRVANELKNRGYDVVIYSDIRFRPDNLSVQIRPLTNRNPYKISTAIGKLESIEQQINALIYEAKIFSQSLRNIDNADITFFPTLFDYQLLSLNSRQKNLGKIIGSLHFDPNHFNRKGYLLWKTALNAIQSMDNIRLGVFEAKLGLRFEEISMLSGISFERFPIPYDDAQSSSLQGELNTIGVLGHQRYGKGIDSIPRLISYINHLGLRAIIQDSSPRPIIKISGGNSNIEVLGYVEDMSKLISKCSIVLLNYKVASYQHTGSGIAWGALASGVPILAPAGTTIANLMADYSCGEIFNSCEKNSIYLKLNEMKCDYSRYKRESMAAKERYGLKHGTIRFADHIAS